MSKLRLVLTLLLTLTLNVSGFAVRAQPPCPAMGASGLQQMDMQMMGADQGCKDHCAEAGKHTQNKHEKPGCCHNAACSAQCSSVSSMTGNLLADAWLPLGASAEKFSTTDVVLSSFPPQTQDRPPKHLL